MALFEPIMTDNDTAAMFAELSDSNGGELGKARAYSTVAEVEGLPGRSDMCTCVRAGDFEDATGCMVHDSRLWVRL